MTEPMTDARLDEIETAWRNAPMLEWLRITTEAVPELVAEVRRLHAAETFHRKAATAFAGQLDHAELLINRLRAQLAAKEA